MLVKIRTLKSSVKSIVSLLTFQITLISHFASDYWSSLPTALPRRPKQWAMLVALPRYQLTRESHGQRWAAAATLRPTWPISSVKLCNSERSTFVSRHFKLSQSIQTYPLSCSFSIIGQESDNFEVFLVKLSFLTRWKIKANLVRQIATVSGRS